MAAAPLAVTLDDIRAAAARILPYALVTPLLESSWLSLRAGRRVLVKWESQQRTGSFKWRGALNKLLCLRQRGVTEVLAASMGNHGIAVAEAARLLGLRATVVVPDSAVPTKINAIQASGAELLVRGAVYEAAEAAGRELAAERGLAFVSPYNDAEVIAGQGTVALEILAQARLATPVLTPLSTLVVPTGGGGLLAGCAVATAAEAVTIIGAQPEHAPAMQQALARGGVIEPIHEEPTLADGLAGNLEPGLMTLEMTVAHAIEVVLVSEPSIALAMRAFATYDHQMVEGSGAVAAAALLDRRIPIVASADTPDGGAVAIVVTGRNLDLTRLRAILV